jgi:hypothetical protein
MVAPKTTKEAQHDETFAEGGDTPMFGEQSATPDRPGNTGKDTGPAPGPKYASGGSGKMFGFSPALEAKAGQTGVR